MSEKTVMLVFGTRPEAIKMAPLVNAFQKTENIKTVVTVTGQHREMLDQVLKIFNIVPDFDLNIMKSGQDLYDVTAKVLVGMRDVFSQVKPNIVLVHGDTSTSTAAALASFYSRIPVGHVEAGLRTYDIYSPWPEEINRQITGRIATYHFAPTQRSFENLTNESVPKDAISITGNTVIDALHYVTTQLSENDELKSSTDAAIKQAGYDVARIVDEDRSMVLITGHRRENFGQGFISICEAIKELAQQFPNVDFVYPMHLNPNVRKPISQVFSEEFLKMLGNVFFIEPLDYLLFVRMMSLSKVVLTDSGGIQEEAPGLGKPVLVMRDTTERPEAVEAGTVKLVGTDKLLIVMECSRLLQDEAYYESMAKASNPYGDGKASGRIVEFVKENI